MFKQSPLALLALVGLLGLEPSASATIINFAATDLVDLVSGEDLWRYHYEVSERTFATDEGFDIFFDPSLYASLTALASPSLDLGSGNSAAAQSRRADALRHRHL